VSGSQQQDSQGEPIVRIVFEAKTCLVSLVRSHSSQAKGGGRTLVLHAEGRHMTLTVGASQAIDR
jgi:hypothetical protein